ncbi:MAG: acyl-CoA dehydrogenase family protein [Deltaproteobacteria bacterium]|nr:acyl-CoA dehydrogenase family protein [Deltaproteobacteria bacterium]
MAELEAFRAEAAEWLDANAPQAIRSLRLHAELGGNWGGRHPLWEAPEMETWLRVCADKGWTAPTWPGEYGGGDLSNAEAKVLEQERKRLQLPEPLTGFGLSMIGPTLLRFGSEAQKQEHLPKIVRGEIRWCQGYSEPEAGSDLASLQARAERDGDDFLINGTKVWTSYGDLSDWIFALVRTNSAVKKQAGISFILIDMETPGVSVRPIKLISGKSPFCEAHFENVRVPLANVLGEIDGGWTVAKALLGHERSMIADVFGAGGGARGRRATLAEQAREVLGGTPGEPLPDALLRDRIAQNEMDMKAFHLTLQRSRDAAKAGQQPGSESSIFKVWATEANQRRTELAMQIAGPQALGWEGAGFDEAELDCTRAWLRARGNSIEGGTSEVQLNIIAKHVLGLPD